jgi:mono/diheme cytochrome c family protein
MTSKRALILLAIVAIIAAAFLVASAQNAKKPEAEKQLQLIKAGQHLVLLGGCNDCHSPKSFTAMGPVPDSTRILSGSPADSKVPDIPVGILAPDQWGFLGSNDMTAWAGPWGVSFAANLTPHQVSGSGAWTEAAFIKAMRTGKHLGTGRDILPPMPWQEVGRVSDGELKAVFAYLKSLKPVDNMVHLPIPPAGK